MKCYAVKLPHMGFEPGAKLHYIMQSYFYTVRKVKGLVGVTTDYPNDCSYALYRTNGDAMQAFAKLCDRHLEEVRFIGEMDVDEKKIRRI